MSVGQSDEHQRNWTEKGWDWATKHGNYDRSREHLNFEVVKGGIIQPVDKSRTITGHMADNLRERDITDPNAKLCDRSTAPWRTSSLAALGEDARNSLWQPKVDLTHGADNSHIRRNKDIERWALDVYRFACEHWGEENVIGFYVHLDELNPHVHCTVIPVDERNKISFNKVFGGKIYDSKKRFFALHDEFAKVNEKWGMKRGQQHSRDRSETPDHGRYRRALSEECTTLEEQIENNKTLLSGLLADIRFAEKRVKGLGTMTANLEEKKKQMIAEMEALAGKS